jgi:hypothetical protein
MIGLGEFELFGRIFTLGIFCEVAEVAKILGQNFPQHKLPMRQF